MEDRKKNVSQLLEENCDVDKLIEFLKSCEEDSVLNLGDLQLSFSYIAVPEFLAGSSNHDTVLLVQKYEFSGCTAEEITYQPGLSSTPVKLDRRSSENENLDITGSPLKCHFLHASECNESLVLNDNSHNQGTLAKPMCYNGLPLKFARMFTAKLRAALQALGKDGMELLVLIACDGFDIMKTTLLGINFSNGSIDYIIVNVHDAHIEAKSLPSLDEYISSLGYGYTSNMIEKNVRASYEILSSDGGKGSSIQLDATWKRPLATLSSPALDAVVTATVEINSSDSRSAAIKMHRDIDLIKAFLDGIESGQGRWTRRQKGLSITKLLDDLFDAIAERRNVDQCDSAERFSLNKMVEQKFSTIRPSIDFTDSIWGILKECESYHELVAALHQIFDAIRKRVIRPTFYIGNNTQIARLSREMMSGQGSEPVLENFTPLYMLIETGLEKIRRDYLSIFQDLSLTTGEMLGPFINWDPSHRKFDVYVNLLQKLHVALQMVLLLKDQLQLPMPVLIHCTSKVLKELGAQTDIQNKFEFNLQSSLIQKVCEGLTPCVWNLQLQANRDKDSGVGGGFMGIYITRYPYSIFTASPQEDVNEKIFVEDEVKLYCAMVRVAPDGISDGNVK